MGMGRFVVAGLVLLALLAPAGARPIRKDDDDWVPDSRIAVLVAEIVLKKAMGEAAYDEYVKDSPVVYDSPLQAELHGPTWYVVRRPGPHPLKRKDLFIIGVARHDARLIRLPATPGRRRFPGGDFPDLVPDARTAAALADLLIRRQLGEEYYKETIRKTIITDGNPLAAQFTNGNWWVEPNFDQQAIEAEQAEAQKKAGPNAVILFRSVSFMIGLGRRDGRVLDITMCCR